MWFKLLECERTLLYLNLKTCSTVWSFKYAVSNFLLLLLFLCVYICVSVCEISEQPLLTKHSRPSFGLFSNLYPPPPQETSSCQHVTSQQPMFNSYGWHTQNTYCNICSINIIITACHRMEISKPNLPQVVSPWSIAPQSILWRSTYDKFPIAALFKHKNLP